MDWIITEDWIETNQEGRCSVGFVVGTELPFRFRIYDADGNLYYEGRSNEEEFEPLDWARFYAGAVTIEYQQPDGSWAVL